MKITKISFRFTGIAAVAVTGAVTAVTAVTMMLSGVQPAHAGELQVLSAEAAGTAYASDLATPEAAAPSKFEQLIELHKNGVLPDPSEVEGIRTGRCYMASAPDQAIGFVLLGKKFSTTTPDKDGPLFPPTTASTFNFAPAGTTSWSDAADRYDTLTKKDEVDFTAVANSSDFQTIVSSVDHDALVASNLPGNLLYSLRRNGNNLVLTNTILRDQEANKAGSIYAACYFFKKVGDL